VCMIIADDPNLFFDSLKRITKKVYILLGGIHTRVIFDFLILFYYHLNLKFNSSRKIVVFRSWTGIFGGKIMVTIFSFRHSKSGPLATVYTAGTMCYLLLAPNNEMFYKR
jgi:hypothetical protein